MLPHGDINSLVLGVFTIVTIGYFATCAIWPFRSCRRCHGSGKLHSPLFKKALRLCPACNGSGLRLRVGRKAWNAYRRLRRSYRRNDTNTHR